MANSNVSVANRLFAYIKYKEDVTDRIVQQYDHSLIFIGDEKQIYAPEMGAYVGIGMTAYNNTLNKIEELNGKITEAMNAVQGQVVSSLYPNLIPDDITNNAKISGLTTVTSMVGGVGIVGINDYNPSTYQATNARYVQVSYGSNGPVFSYVNTLPSEIGYNPTLVPSSGINVRYEQQVSTAADGTTTQTKNILYIDDSATWDYIAHNSDVQLAANKKYIDSEINKIYHDLLGENVSYLPVSFANVFDSISTDGNNTPLHTIDTGVNYYYKVECTANDPNKAGIGINGNGNEVPFKYVQAEFDANGQLINLENSDYWLEVLPGHSGIPQLYVAPEESANTYNVSLRDGINTLKEVASLLDKLSDGSLGSVTYISYADYNQLTPTQQASYNIIPGASTAAGSIEPYAYTVVEGSAEDLGIKMAYSIAGNKAEIDHLHEHIRKAEAGLTSLRSINTKFNSSLGTLSVTGTLPNNSYFSELNPGTSVNGYVGDAAVSLNLVLTNTYLSINSTAWSAGGNSTFAQVNAGFGKVYYGEYLKVKPEEIDTDAARLTGNEEGRISVFVLDEEADQLSFANIGSFTASDWAGLAATEDDLLLIENIKAGTSSIPQGTYFFIKTNPSYARDEFDNITWIKVSESDIRDGIYANKTVYSEYFKKKNDGRYEAWTSNAVLLNEEGMLNPSNNVDLTNVYVYKKDEVKPYELKPIIYSDTNAIATADWVSSYISQEIGKVNAAQSNFESNIENTINTKLNNLDYEYKYSDFESFVWRDYVTYVNQDPATALTPGSTKYWEEYSKYYNSFKNLNSDFSDPTSYINQAYRAANGINDSSYVVSGKDITSNLVRNSYESTAIVNIIQTDGKVSAEARELPTDKVNVNVDVWGETSSLDAKPVFTALSDNTRNDIDDSITYLTNGGNIADTLYNLQKATNELYVVENTDTQYEAVRAGENVSSGALYFYNQETGEFVADNNVSNDTRAAITAGNKNYVGWKQYYRAVSATKYVEINIPATEFTAADGFTFTDVEGGSHGPISIANFASSVYYISGYVLPDGTTASENDSAVAALDGDNLSEKLRKYVASKRYLTAEFEHNDAANGGHGENTLNLTAHIKKLEDATPENTGFADAWDVKNYIHELFRFVDVSASISASILQNRDAFYTLISYAEYEAAVNAGHTPDIYEKVNSTWTLVSSPKLAQYYNSNNNYAGPTGESIQATSVQFNRGNSSVDRYTPATHNYYICHETVWTNPLNRVETNHGA